MTKKETAKLNEALAALETLHGAASSYGMMTAGLMPLDSMETEYFEDEHLSLSRAIVAASKILRA